MCGIIGVVSSAGPVSQEWLRLGRDTLSHRGPDDLGEWWSADGRVGLAHRRLSIVDPTTAGHQPMLSHSGELAIVFNGEIYNFQELRERLTLKGHVFRSRSDTEVILAAYKEWGTACVDRLNGMFAFAIYDHPQRSLFLARDRAGEKPLFYTVIGSELRFASELKGLLADSDLPRQVNPYALDCFLGLGYVPGALCILRGISKLPPAHALTYEIRSGFCRTWKYWHLPETPTHVTASDEALASELEHLLSDSVRRQLVADVPVGILLSGGIDSSLVTALASRHISRVRTFTVCFPGHGELDETEHARFIARHFDTLHTELEANWSSVDILPRLAHQLDEPMIDSSLIPTYMVSRVIRQHCTVALGGDGGDELFAGYPHYDRLMWMAKNLGWLPLTIRRTISVAAEQMLPIGFRGRNWLGALGADLRSTAELPMLSKHFDRRTRGLLVKSLPDPIGTAEELWALLIPRERDLLQRATRMDFQNYLPEDILVKVDRASMLSSLEVRAPMLDTSVIEFAFGKVPSRLKATSSARKILLRRLASRILPPGFDLKRKQGFSIPLSNWLQSPAWQALVNDTLLSGSSPFFDRDIVRHLLSSLRRSRKNSERLFGLLMFELWRQTYRVSL